jgi:WD40 repeat protein
MTTTYALLVGIEKYDIDPGFDVPGPCAFAIELAKWLLSRNTPAGNIFMFLEPLESAPLEDEIRALQKAGLSIERSGALDTIKAFWQFRLPKLGGSGARFFFYWCGHGYAAADGSRLFLCRDYQDTDFLRDRVFDASGFIRLLRSPDFHFADHLLLADVCAKPEEYAGQLAPRIPVPTHSSGARQVWIFATTEGASSYGQFTSVILRILKTYVTWPAQGEFVSRVLSSCRESGIDPFLGVHGFDGNSDISLLLGPTLSDAESMLEQGALRVAINCLLSLYPRLGDSPEVSLWERLAYRILRKVSSMPIQSISWPEGRLSSIDTSDEDWFLAIGTRDGAAYVKRLMIPISPVREDWQTDYWRGGQGPLTVSLMGETLNLVRGQDQCPPADVSFPPGARLNQSLMVRRGLAGGSEFQLSTDVARPPSLWKEIKRELVAFRRYAGSVSLTPQGSLTIMSRDRAESIALPLPDEIDRFVALELIEGEGLEEGQLWIACLSQRGRLYVVDAGGGRSFQDLDGAEQARRLYAVPAHHSFIVETERKLFVANVWGVGPVSMSLDLVPAHPEKRITSSIMFQMSAKGTDIALGYEDGSVEICPAQYLASTQNRRTVFSLHRDPVIALGRIPGYVGFFSVSRESVAMLRNPVRGADFMVFPPRSEITTACLTRDGSHLITAHIDQRLMLWDVERPGRGDIRAFRNQRTNDRSTFISDVLSTVVQARWLVLNAGVKIHNGSLWVFIEASPFVVTRNAFTPVTEGPGGGTYLQARFCWSLTGDSILLLQTSSNQIGDIHSYTRAPLTVVRFVEDGVFSQEIRIGNREPTAYAAHPFEDAYCVGFDDGTVLELSFRSIGSPSYKVKRMSAASGVPVTSCAYSPDGRYLAISLESEPHMMIADLKSKLVQPLNNSAGAEADTYTGPASFGPHGNVLFVCTNDGGVASLDIQGNRAELLKSYRPPQHRSRSLQFLSLATNGAWFVAGVGGLVYRWKTDGGPDPAVCTVSDAFQRHLTAVPHADRFVSIGAHGECKCWDALSLERVADVTEDADWHNDVAFSPDGSLVSLHLNGVREAAVFPIFKTALVPFDCLKGLVWTVPNSGREMNDHLIGKPRTVPSPD